MCGRFALYSPIKRVSEEFSAHRIVSSLSPSYNIAPSHHVVAIFRETEVTLGQCQWGFVPHWAKDPSVGYKMINARAETVADKPSFRDAFRKKRCIIAADGFYEWKKIGKQKTPMYVRLRSRNPFGFAGFCSTRSTDEGDECTCTIITTGANTLLEDVHDRMPVILPKKDYTLWLDPGLHDVNTLQELLVPFPSEEMEYFPVSPRVNSPSHNAPDCIEPEG